MTGSNPPGGPVTESQTVIKPIAYRDGPAPGSDREHHRTPLWYGLQKLSEVAYHTLFDLHVWGLRNVPARGGAILAANHQSFLDPPIVAVSLRRPVSFMAKSELFENRYFGGLISNLHAFPIRQGKGDRAAIVETVSRLREGHLLNMYPEGSRSDDGEVAELASGIALVVRKAQVPVVPVALDGSFALWPKGQTLPKRGGPLKVVYGPSLKLWHLPPAEVLSTLRFVLQEMLKDVRCFPAGATGEPVSVTKSPAPRDLLWRE